MATCRIECLQIIHLNKVLNLEYITKKGNNNHKCQLNRDKDLHGYFHKEHVAKAKRHTNRYFNITGH